MADLKNVELLAPCGDMETLETSLRYGADAVYLGGPLMQMRADTAGFNWENMEKAAGLIHGAGKKMFVTVNIFPGSDEIPLLGEYAGRLNSIGADALIVSDIGAIAEIKEKNPDIEIHLSTQANCMNYRAARVYHSMGVSRIVLARELSIESIKRLRDNIPGSLQLEAFVHGAMCMAYSGRCMISAFTTGRSGNRGKCAQSCRWNYYLMEEKRPGEYFKVEESDRGMAILSSKELCCVDILQDLADAGICSFKIEGRMRTPFYDATVVNAYRLLMDGKITPAQAREELETVSHRPFCTGFYLSDPEAIAPDTLGYIRDHLFVAKTLEDSRNGYVTVETRNPFKVGDELAALQPGSLGRKFIVTSIVDPENGPIERSAVPMKVLKINAPEGIPAGSIIRL